MAVSGFCSGREWGKKWARDQGQSCLPIGKGFLIVPALKVSLGHRTAHGQPGPDSYIGLDCGVLLQLVPPAVHLCPASPTPFTRLYCCAHPIGRSCSDRGVCWQPGALHPRLALALATNPGSQPYRQLTPQPSVCTLLAQATATACPDPQPLKVSLRPPTALAATVDPLPSSPGTMMLLMLWPELSSYHITLDLELIQPPYLEPCTIRRVTVHSRMPLLTGEGLSLQKSVHEVGKRWLLLQMHRYPQKAMGIMKNQRNTLPPKKHSKPPVIDTKETDTKSEQNEKLSKGQRRLKKNPTGILTKTHTHTHTHTQIEVNLRPSRWVLFYRRGGEGPKSHSQ